MFLNEFEDEKTEELKDSKSKTMKKSKAGDSDEDAGLGSAGNLGSPTNKAKVLQQQKELQMKKMQTRMGSGYYINILNKHLYFKFTFYILHYNKGLIVSTDEKLSSSTRQLSKPKRFDVLNLHIYDSSEFPFKI